VVAGFLHDEEGTEFQVVYGCDTVYAKQWKANLVCVATEEGVHAWVVVESATAGSRVLAGIELLAGLEAKFSKLAEAEMFSDKQGRGGRALLSRAPVEADKEHGVGVCTEVDVLVERRWLPLCCGLRVPSLASMARRRPGWYRCGSGVFKKSSTVV
jgi:hypothetical protein